MTSLSASEFRAMPAFARHAHVAAWFVPHPAPPIGTKPCRTCGKPMLARDKHARCQRCRKPEGWVSKKYPRTCEQCGKHWMADEAKRRFCSKSCAGKAKRRKA